MKANEYQALAMRTSNKALSNREHLINGALGLCGESGEVADIIKKHTMQGHPLNHEHIAAVRLYPKGVLNKERFEKGKRAAAFFLSFWHADCDRIAIENPAPMKCFGLPPYSYIDEPFKHGDPWRKRTCFWLKNLAPLHPTNIVEPLGLWVGSTCANRDPSIYTRYKLRAKRDSKERSKTFPGIARAMAEQWAGRTEE